MLAAPPVFDEARRLGLECIQPSDVNSAEALERIGAGSPDAVVAVAFGQLIRKPLLRLAPRGVLNLHPSLLPRHRGASPIQTAILCGDVETGVTIMAMDRGLDTGPTFSRRATPIHLDETTPGLERRLAQLGADLLVETLDSIALGRLRSEPQDEALATMTERLGRSDGEIDWDEPAVKIHRLWRALQPWPGVHTFAGGRTLKILECAVSRSADCRGPAGHPTYEGGKLLVVTGDGCIEVTHLQPEGRKAMSDREFSLGYAALMNAKWGR